MQTSHGDLYCDASTDDWAHTWVRLALVRVPVECVFDAARWLKCGALRTGLQQAFAAGWLADKAGPRRRGHALIRHHCLQRWQSHMQNWPS